ncbi:hypothetical protein [Lachnoclostridium sp.]|uniref:hypothetical protein n=1 Tax=Lachnoclostridium sp. TaxID=2028282 RepID=UPI00289E9676|nr:hypothetical protein [Lachnoclostridium sp.]
MKKRAKSVAALLTVLFTMVMLTACTAVQISSNLVINSDGSGSRTIQGLIAKNDFQDGYGSAYYYFKKHGADLEQHLKGIYDSKVKDSSEWLAISVDDSDSEWEVVTLSFDFSSFEDYTSKLNSLAFDETAAASFVNPTFDEKEDGIVTYTESTGVMTSIFKSLQNNIMADDSIYDPESTKDGVALNDGSADGQLEEYGVELMKPEVGDALTIQINGGDPVAVTQTDGIYSYTATATGEKVVEEKEKSCVLNYSFDDTLSNAGTAADNDLTYGVGSTEGGPVYVPGIDGNGIKFDGKTYLASPNKTYNYDEMTISFYYAMDEYTQTDSGANMVIVPAGLGALGAGVVDVEFVKDSSAEGIQFLGKVNSSDWQTQDKLFSEGYFMEAHMKEWHNYTLVFQNEYDEDGAIEDAFVYMYIDGKLATKSRLSVAAGLTFSLGAFDDGSAGDPNGGFNIGGYFENNTVKRACTGILDNLMVFDGVLTEEEIQTLCYTTKVEKEYNPDVIDTVDSSQDADTEEVVDGNKETSKEETKDSNTAMYVVLAIALLGIVGVIVTISVRKKKSK